MRTIASWLIVVFFGGALVAMTIHLFIPDAAWFTGRSPVTGVCYEFHSFHGWGQAMAQVPDEFCAP